jgi:hypothetical protein
MRKGSGLCSHRTIVYPAPRAHHVIESQKYSAEECYSRLSGAKVVRGYLKMIDIGISSTASDRSDNAYYVQFGCRSSLEMSCFSPLEMSGSKDGMDFYERARSETD